MALDPARAVAYDADMRTTLSAAETARLVGVSRARVYQRLDGWDAHSRPLQSHPEPCAVARSGTARRIAVADALAWRAERLAAGAPVGPLPDWLALRTTSPVAPLRVDVLPEAVERTEAVAGGIGLPSLRPF